MSRNKAISILFLLPIRSHFLKVPFGLCNSPPVFQRFINHIFRTLINEGIVLLYLDDLIVIATDVEEDIKRLRGVLQVASDYGLDINK